MSIASTLSRYLSTNASVTQLRVTLTTGRNKSLQAINGTDTTPLHLSIWPTTLMWKMQGSGSSTEGERLEDRFQGAVSDITYDIQAGDVLNGYPKPETQLVVSAVNIYDDGAQPLPHLGLLLRRYSHTG